MAECQHKFIIAMQEGYFCIRCCKYLTNEEYAKAKAKPKRTAVKKTVESK